MTAKEYDLELHPMMWIISREGGYVKEGGKGTIHMAEIKRLDTGMFRVTSGMVGVRSAMQELGLWDGQYEGPVCSTYGHAIALAKRAIAYTLDLHWTTEATRDEVTARHKKATT